MSVIILNERNSIEVDYPAMFKKKILFIRYRISAFLH
jgi:hypothetical protein